MTNTCINDIIALVNLKGMCLWYENTKNCVGYCTYKKKNYISRYAAVFHVCNTVDFGIYILLSADGRYNYSI